MTRPATMAEIVAETAAQSHADALLHAMSAAHVVTSDGGGDLAIEFNDHSVALFSGDKLYSITIQLDFDRGGLVAPLHDQIIRLR